MGDFSNKRTCGATIKLSVAYQSTPRGAHEVLFQSVK